MPDGFALVALLVATLRAATPLLLAGFGELVAERAGVLNLGVEGMMLVGAAAGFIATASTGNPALGLAVAALAGALMALLFGFLTLTLRANQVACGLALTIFGVGLSALIGLPYQGTPITGLATVIWPKLDAASPMAQQLMLLDPMVWLALATPGLVWVFLYRTRRGLVVRAVGESHDVAHALGYSVLRVRYAAVLFGGAMAGLAGAYLSLVYTPMWTREHGGRARLDRARLGGVLRLEAGLAGARRRAVRLRHHRAIPRRRLRPRRLAASAVDAALPRHRGGAGADLPRRDAAEAQCPGGAGQAVQRHRLNPETVMGPFG